MIIHTEAPEQNFSFLPYSLLPDLSTHFIAKNKVKIHVGKEIILLKTKVTDDWSDTATENNHRLAGHNKKENQVTAYNKKDLLLVYTS